ncbi:MAG: response regulator, partial [Clostridia bacterium]
MARIYIVEDDESIAELIAATLQAAGHQTHIAPDADHLAEALRTGVPQLLLLDLMLPGKDGLTLLREWKQASATQAVPVIILS